MVNIKFANTLLLLLVETQFIMASRLISCLFMLLSIKLGSNRNKQFTQSSVCAEYLMTLCLMTHRNHQMSSQLIQRRTYICLPIVMPIHKRCQDKIKFMMALYSESILCGPWIQTYNIHGKLFIDIQQFIETIMRKKKTCRGTIQHVYKMKA